MTGFTPQHTGDMSTTTVADPAGPCTASVAPEGHGSGVWPLRGQEGLCGGRGSGRGPTCNTSCWAQHELVDGRVGIQWPQPLLLPVTKGQRGGEQLLRWPRGGNQGSHPHLFPQLHLRPWHCWSLPGTRLTQPGAQSELKLLPRQGAGSARYSPGRQASGNPSAPPCAWTT